MESSLLLCHDITEQLGILGDVVFSSLKISGLKKNLLPIQARCLQKEVIKMPELRIVAV